MSDDNKTMEDLTAEGARAACISKGTASAYSSGISMISKWIHMTQSHPNNFFDENGILDINVFQPRHFEQFIMDRVNDSSNPVTVNTLSGYRSAVKNMYRMRNKPVPTEYGERMKTLFSGLKRYEAERVQSGEKNNTGKSPLRYSTYQDLCRKTMLMEDGGFAHLFLTLQWNLMCRSKSVQTIDSSHISYEDDSIGFTFHKTKTNQDGSAPKDARHVYANPFDPTTCCITALGLYWACHPDQGIGQLFPGSQQKNRFGKAIARVLNTKEYGTHSVRKGVATYACSGSTGGPSIVSVCLRVGWSIGSIQDRYLRYEAAGDQFLGRVVAGLPLNKSDFAVLPPHFKERNDPLVDTTVAIMFPNLKNEQHLLDVLKMCLACLVFHAPQLKKILPIRHPLYSTYLFRESNVLNILSMNISIDGNDWLQPTGIPPHIELYRQQEVILETLNKLPEVLTKELSELIERKGVQAGNITHDLLKKTLKELIEQHLTTGNEQEVVSEATNDSSYELYSWNSGLHPVPEDFDFPSVDTLTAWKLWWLGNKSLKYPPYRMIKAKSLSTRKKQQTCSEWRVMMDYISEIVKSKTNENMSKRPTEAELQRYFDIAKDYLPLIQTTSQNRSRRSSQLKMVTVLRLVREAKRACNQNRSVVCRKRVRRKKHH